MKKYLGLLCILVVALTGCSGVDLPVDIPLLATKTPTPTITP